MPTADHGGGTAEIAIGMWQKYTVVSIDFEAPAATRLLADDRGARMSRKIV